LASNASTILIVHNHPSGDCTPSQEDINVTKRLKECGTLLGIELLDHLIVAGASYVSLKERGIV
jgi:DNA repair protein RadC